MLFSTVLFSTVFAAPTIGVHGSVGVNVDVGKITAEVKKEGKIDIGKYGAEIAEKVKVAVGHGDYKKEVDVDVNVNIGKKPDGDKGYGHDKDKAEKDKKDKDYKGDKKPEVPGTYGGDKKPEGDKDKDYKGDKKPEIPGTYGGDKKPEGDKDKGYKGDKKPDGTYEKKPDATPTPGTYSETAPQAQITQGYGGNAPIVSSAQSFGFGVLSLLALAL
jgi:hypothetical protein